MPLSFQSLSHGQVAFGFFNIETDMACLNQYFFFAAEFATLVGEMAKCPRGPIEASLPAYALSRTDAGNLMGAIEGIDFRGFIGETYKLYPFPKDPDRFKQNPEAYMTRDIIEPLIAKYAPKGAVTVKADSTGASVAMAEYLFSRPSFHELVKYVWVGGYPRYKDGVRPDYVEHMKERTEGAGHPLFAGLRLEA